VCNLWEFLQRKLGKKCIDDRVIMIGRSQNDHFMIERRSLIEWSVTHKAIITAISQSLNHCDRPITSITQSLWLPYHLDHCDHPITRSPWSGDHRSLTKRSFCLIEWPGDHMIERSQGDHSITWSYFN